MKEVFWSHKLDFNYLLKYLGRGWWMGRIYRVAAHWISFSTPTKWKCQGWEGSLQQAFWTRGLGPGRWSKSMVAVTQLQEDMWPSAKGAEREFLCQEIRPCCRESGYKGHLLILVAGRARVSRPLLGLWQGSASLGWASFWIERLNMRGLLMTIILGYWWHLLTNNLLNYVYKANEEANLRAQKWVIDQAES